MSSLVSGGKWAEVEAIFRNSIQDRTLFRTVAVTAALLEALTGGESSSPSTIDRNFACLVDVLTRHGKVYLWPVEKALLAQLAGTLMVHIDGMEK